MKVLILLLLMVTGCAIANAQHKVSHPDSLKIRTLKQKVIVLAESGLYDSVMVSQHKLIAIYLNHKRWKEAIKTQIAICAAALRKSDYDNVERSVGKGFDIVYKHLPGDAYALSEFHNLRGVLAYEQGDYDKAITNLKQSLEYQLKIANGASFKDLATKYNNLAAIVSRKGDFDEAIFFYTKSLNLRKQYGDELEIGESYNNLSVSYYRKKMFSEALDFQEQYLEILDKRKEENLTREYILCYNSLGIYYLETKDYNKALEILNKALTLNSIDEYLIEKTHHNLGYAYRLMNDDEKSLHYLHRALDLNRRKYKNGHPDIGKEYRHLGAIEVRNGNHKKGLRYFQKALINLAGDFTDSSFLSNPLLVNIRSKPDLLRTLRDKASALRALAENTTRLVYMEASLSTYQHAMQLIEQMREEYESEAARQFIIEEALPVYAGALETIVCLQNSGRTEFLTQAFEVIEKSKALLLTESLQRKSRAEAFGVPDSLLQQEKRFKINVAFYEKQLIEVKSKNDSASALRHAASLHTYQDRQRTLQTTFQRNYPHYYSNRNQFSVNKLSDVSEFLKQTETVLVEYFLSEDKLWIFIATADHTRLIEKNKPAVFDKWISSYLRSLKDYSLMTDSAKKSYDLYRTSAFNLYKFLLEDVESDFRKNLLIVPHNQLAYLPFESLLMEPSPDRFNGYTNLSYLIREQSISYAYSATLHLAQSTRINTTATACIAFAPGFNQVYPKMNKKLSNLPQSRNELSLIKKILNGRFYTDEEATKQVFKSEAGNYGVIHLASHSIIDENSPSNSKIYFSQMTDQEDDNVLHAYEIANLSLKADLVVLSACETGSGMLAKGEGVMSIGRSFMYAGSRSVLMNLWKSEDWSNASIITTFYTHLGDGESKVNSLRQAKLNYLKETDEFRAHPAFWAGYILVGHNGAINSDRNFLLFFVLGGLGVVALLILILARKYGHTIFKKASG